ncbi:disulfide bond formation protein B [Pseudomonas sp. dw_358]|uniref:disulfide bond formation protein B n=1 Tax=Pseudomonas sp. dw_358 TaxID=2720083 RepID=UPI001BD629D4|nr:disulfide bond formation protein B [Pseudomonas sp. dw_358]
MALARTRLLYFVAFVASSLILSVAVYLQFSVGLYPCSLYQVQQFFLGAFALVCLLAALHGPGRQGSRVYGAMALGMALSGALAAVRQLWLQGRVSAPESLCHADLRCLWNTEPVGQTIRSLLLGSAECARVNWSLLDMSWPEWSLLAFVAMLVFSFLQLFQHGRAEAAAL